MKVFYWRYIASFWIYKWYILKKIAVLSGG